MASAIGANVPAAAIADAAILRHVSSMSETSIAAGLGLADGLAAADAAEAHGDHDVALGILTQLCAAFPSDPTAYHRACGVLSGLGRFAEAVALLRPVEPRFQNDIMIAAGLAWAVHHGGERKAALMQWERFRARFPDHPAGWVAPAGLLRLDGEFDAAEALLRAAMARLRDDPWPASEHAMLAAVRQDWREAARRCIALRQRFPGEPLGFVGGVAALREQGTPDLADALAEAGLERFPDSLELWREYAWTASRREDWLRAAARWEQARRRKPDDLIAYHRAAEALSKLGQHDAAEVLLVDAVARFPDHPTIAVAFIDAAVARGDVTEALRRSHAARRRIPLDRVIQSRLFELRLRLLESDPAAAAGADPVLDLMSPEDRHMHDLMMAFESLGGTALGCEFGGVQRAFGAEPLGLLRWSDLGPDHLSAALEQRFEGVGEPENTELSVSPGLGYPEYITRDTRFHMGMHTFVAESAMPAERMLRTISGRLRLLRRKLIEELEAGDKLFVYKRTTHDLTEAELSRLHKAVRSYGEATLFYVRYADAAHPPGTVEQAAPGLLVGFVERFAVARGGELLPLPVDEWAAVCRKAYALWRGETSAGEP